MYRSGDPKEVFKLVKLLYIDPESFEKPMNLTDKMFLARAKANIFDEFAVALNIEPSEVDSYIMSYLNKK